MRFYVSVVDDFSGFAVGDVLQMRKKKQVAGGGGGGGLHDFSWVRSRHAIEICVDNET